MRTIFYARGPNIAQKLVLKPFQNIELYNLMAALLTTNSEIPPNNGTEGRLNKVLKDIPVRKPQRAKPLEKCSSGTNTSEAEMLCTSEILSLVSGSKEFCYLPTCSANYLRAALILSPESNRNVALIERINPILFGAKKSRKTGQHANFTTTSLSLQGTNNMDVVVYRGFLEGHFTDLQKLISRYAMLNDEIVVVSGPVHDFDDNGVADPITKSQLDWKSDTMPSHIFRAIFRCFESRWLTDKFQCTEPERLQALAFILPNVPMDNGCLDSKDYLASNIAKLRDIELLTGLEFLPRMLFSEQEIYNDDFAITLRTMMPEKLWDT